MEVKVAPFTLTVMSPIGFCASPASYENKTPVFCVNASVNVFTVADLTERLKS